jgi:inhibitor of cysteine peptidase
MGINRYALCTLVVSCAWVILGCSTGSFAPESAPEEATVLVTEEQDGLQVNLGKGDFLLVRLQSNPSTGYSWELINNDEAILRQLGESEFRASSNAVGAGGTETFRFEAVGEGASVIRMIYHRSFEEDEEPLETFTLRVVVE